MKKEVAYLDFGLIDYQVAWDKQRTLFDELLKKKTSSTDGDGNCFILCEHPHVYTLGRSGEDANLLISDDFLKRIGASFYRIDRGGDITYHGPGQIVGYPILDLESFKVSLKDYIHSLEEVVIRTIAEYGIVGERLNGATGVWIDAQVPSKARKICAIGVKASHFITMHGFALNVSTNLDYFNYINPCGFVDKGVTSIEKELGRKVDLQEVKNTLASMFESVFCSSLHTYNNSAEAK